MARFWLTRLRQRFYSSAARQRRPEFRVEQLEDRVVPAAASTTPLYDYVREGKSTATPSLTGPQGQGGFSPAEIEQAYGTNLISFSNAAGQTIAGDGAGTTIAIVDAYNDPTIKSDLKAFDAAFDLPNPVFNVMNAAGGSKLPANNAGWAGEISLDVEWAHAIAPKATIDLVEASGQSIAQLFAAVKYAGSIPGVNVVTMSFGIPEAEMQDNPNHSEQVYDSTVFAPGLHPGVTFMASSGDHGAPVNYPSVSPYVLAVGGTSLTVNAAGYWQSESGWGEYVDGEPWGSTGGISQYEAQPSYQAGVVTQSSTNRTTPDVAYDANLYTGFDVYETYGNSTVLPWTVVGGTSDASPQWAGLVAIADQGRALNGTPSLDNSTLMPWLYSIPSTDYNTVVGGTSPGLPPYSVTPGYNLVTGLGTPIANELIPNMVYAGAGDTFAMSAAATSVAATTASAAAAAGTDTVTLSKDITVSVVGDQVRFGTSSTVYTIAASSEGAGGTTTITLSTNLSADVTMGETATIATAAPDAVTAGQTVEITIDAIGPSGAVITGDNDTVTITSTDPTVASFTVTLDKGTATFPVTFETAGLQSIAATDSSSGATVTGTESGIVVSPAAAATLAFIQQPSTAAAAAVMSPAVTVAVEDQYGNILTSDNSTQVTLAIGSNPSGGTLTGVGPITTVNGIARFGSLEVSAIGTGYTLTASANGFTQATSSAFNVTASPVLENFANGWPANYSEAGGAASNASVTAAAAHPGTSTEGLSLGGDMNWYYRTDAAGQIAPGDTVSVWVEFPTAATGRAYFGFGSTSAGTDSVVLAPNSNQLIIQSNTGYDTFTQLGAVSQTYAAKTWYLITVEWQTNGTVTATLTTPTGATTTVTASANDTKPGDFAFRSTGGSVYFDTVTLVSTTTGVVGGANLPATTISSVDQGKAAAETSPPTSTTGTGITQADAEKTKSKK